MIAARLSAVADVDDVAVFDDVVFAFEQELAGFFEMDFGGVIMTVDQAIEHVKHVKAAIADVLKACPSLGIPPVKFEDLDA